MIPLIIAILAIMILPLWMLIQYLKYQAEIKALEAKGYPQSHLEILRAPKQMNTPTHSAFVMATLQRPQPDKQK